MVDLAVRPVQESRTQQALNTMRVLYGDLSESAEKPLMRSKKIGEKENE
jgi:hypothetical protein